MGVKPLADTRTRSERVRDLIEEGIVTGKFRPGMRLEETDLAQRFAVSRTPLREALFQLASSGLVELQPRRGAVVTEITPARLLEMFEVMGELESMCGRLAARRMTAVEHSLLIGAHRACAKAKDSSDPDAYYYENERFHVVIYQGGRNDFLTEQALALHRRLRPYRRLQLRVANRTATSFGEHQAIVDALLAGDCDRSAHLMRSHVVVQGERFTELLATVEALRAGDDATSESEAAVS